MTTIYELRWGGSGRDKVVEEQTRYFRPFEECDAAVRLSERIIELDRDDTLPCAFASLRRLPDNVFPAGMTLVSWTKTSDERPIVEGVATEAEARG